MRPLHTNTAALVASCLAVLAALACSGLDVVAAPSSPVAAAPDTAAAVADGSKPAGDASALPAAGLGATTDPPWNPPRPRGDATPWEAAVRLPGRILSLPLVAVGWASEHAMLTAQEHSVVPKVGFAFAVLPRYGVTLQGAAIGDRAGLGALVGVSPPRLPFIQA